MHDNSDMAIDVCECCCADDGETIDIEVIKKYTEKITKSHKESDELCLTITGAWCSCGRVVGYCHSALHKGCLTKQLMDKHQCLEKRCLKFYKFDAAPYWRSEESKRKKKNDLKEKRKNIKLLTQQYLEVIRQLTIRDRKFYAVDLEYVTEYKSGYFVVWFVSFGSIDCDEYINLFGEHCDNARFYLKKIKNSRAKKLKIVEHLGIPKLLDGTSESDTAYLSSIEGMEKMLIEGRDAPLSECIPESEVEW